MPKTKRPRLPRNVGTVKCPFRTFIVLDGGVAGDGFHPMGSGFYACDEDVHVDVPELADSFDRAANELRLPALERLVRQHYPTTKIIVVK